MLVTAESAETALEARSPFSFGVFRNIWIANLGSHFGTLIQGVGASWFMVAAGASPQMIALVQASISLPVVLLSLIAGAIADNMDRRKVMLFAQLFLAVVAGALAVLAWFDLATPWLLLAFTFLIGCGTAMNGPAWQASVGDMVPRPVLPAAVAHNAMGLNLARSVGPAIGGVIVAVGGAASAFFVNALSSLGLVAVLAKWKPEREPNPLPPEKLTDAMVAGVRYVSMAPKIRVALLRAVMFGLGASGIQALLPLVARDLLGGGPLVFGILLASFGVGAVASALMTKRVQKRFSTNATLRLATLLTTIAAAGAAVSPYLVLTCLFLTLAGGGWVMAFAVINVSVQLASPRWVVARALSLYQMSVFAGVAGGAWMIGYAADNLGTQASLYLAAGFNIAMILLAFLVPLAAFSTENLDPTNRWEQPDTAVPIVDRSGPIVIAIDHHVPAENTEAFLSVMSLRRRARIRDGARRWTLLRDLNNPDLWVERYHLPTWLDYVRHNLRRTEADQEIADRLQELRVDHSEPVIHRMIERQVSSRPDPQDRPRSPFV